MKQSKLNSWHWDASKRFSVGSVIVRSIRKWQHIITCHLFLFYFCISWRKNFLTCTIVISAFDVWRMHLLCMVGYICHEFSVISVLFHCFRPVETARCGQQLASYAAGVPSIPNPNVIPQYIPYSSILSVAGTVPTYLPHVIPYTSPNHSQVAAPVLVIVYFSLTLWRNFSLSNWI